MSQAIISRTLWISILIGIAIVLFGLATEAALSLRDAARQRVVLPKNTDVSINKDGSMNIVTDEGTMSTSTTIPTDWPTDVPTYPGADVTYAASLKPIDANTGRTALMLTASDPREDIVSFYDRALQKNGWTIVRSVESGETIFRTATKDRRTLTLSIATAEGHTGITLSIERRAT